jgi:hypothetical protein
MAGPGAQRETADFHESWVAALEVLELEVDRAEDLLRCHADQLPDAVPWTPPTGLGVLPLTLLTRARALHDRQLEVAAGLAVAMLGNRRQAALVEAIDNTRPGARPVFVDRAC